MGLYGAPTRHVFKLTSSNLSRTKSERSGKVYYTVLPRKAYYSCQASRGIAEGSQRIETYIYHWVTTKIFNLRFLHTFSFCVELRSKQVFILCEGTYSTICVACLCVQTDNTNGAR